MPPDKLMVYDGIRPMVYEQQPTQLRTSSSAKDRLKTLKAPALVALIAFISKIDMDM